MDSIPFLSIDRETISLEQALEYLKSSGLFPQVLADILRQHILQQEFKTRTDLKIESVAIDQSILDFRLEAQLQESERFNQWLVESRLSYTKFREQIEFRLKIEELKTSIAEPQLEKYFEERKPFLDRVVLSRLILEERELAKKLEQELSTDREKFNQLVKQHSITDDRIFNGMMGSVSQGEMPEELKKSVNLAHVGDIIGALEIENRFCFFRVESLLPASLNNRLQQQLKEELFETWLQEKLQILTVKLEI